MQPWDVAVKSQECLPLCLENGCAFRGGWKEPHGEVTREWRAKVVRQNLRASQPGVLEAQQGPLRLKQGTERRVLGWAFLNCVLFIGVCMHLCGPLYTHGVQETTLGSCLSPTMSAHVIRLASK